MRLRFRYWLLIMTLVVLVQGYFLGAIHPFMPQLFLAVVIVAAAALPAMQAIGLGLWGGFLLDSISLQPAGLYVLIGGGAALITVFFITKGLTLANWSGRGVIVALGLLWLYFCIAGLAFLQSQPALELAPYIWAVLLQYGLTLLFATWLASRVQLRV